MDKEEIRHYNCHLSKEQLASPYDFKSEYEWNGADAEDWKFFGRYDVTDAVLEEKYL